MGVTEIRMLKWMQTLLDMTVKRMNLFKIN